MSQSQHHTRIMISLLFVTVILSTITFGWRWLTEPQTWPITDVRITGKFVHLQQNMLAERAATVVRGGFFAIDVAAIRAHLQASPWVREVSVRRVWPGTLELQIIEQVAVVRWGVDGVLNDHGEVFYPEIERLPAGLPRLSGPEGSEAQVLARYRDLTDWFKPLQIDINELQMNSRQAWHFQIVEGPVVVIGKKYFSGRVKRLIRVFNSLANEQLSEIGQIDLRYTNGFAMSRKQMKKNSEGSA